MSDDEFAVVNRRKRDNPSWLAESPEYDEFVMACLEHSVQLLREVGAEANDANGTVDDALVAVLTASKDDPSLPFPDVLSREFLEALSLTFLLLPRLQVASFQRQWHAAVPTDAAPALLDTADALRALVAGMTDEQQARVVLTYQRLPHDQVVALFEVPKLQMCSKLAQCWRLPPVPSGTRHGVNGHDAG
ncbi:hypothetical protein AB0H83_08720 [Dactylosporangium sp. NPDC050688]|uniref:hypothetical protein n=1 Tax=Dactylosporangium sp. NPDC050688 TaxID=3157217 RepID=UPI0033E4E018